MNNLTDDISLYCFGKGLQFIFEKSCYSFEVWNCLLIGLYKGSGVSFMDLYLSLYPFDMHKCNRISRFVPKNYEIA